MKDAFKREIKVGDTVVYGVRQGSTQSLCFGVVLDVTKRKRRYSEEPYETLRVECFKSTEYAGRLPREVTLSTPRNVVVVGAGL